MIRVLGIADIMAGLIFLGGAFNFHMPIGAVISFGLYLLGKGIIFVIISLDWGSLIDVAAGIILLMGIFFVIPKFIAVFFALFLLIKGGVSLFS